ncbi:MAG TPA: efflux RND transporter periplasmic adaptor subunit, partial [Candidatus Baltobacteraceae bacterium]
MESVRKKRETHALELGLLIATIAVSGCSSHGGGAQGPPPTSVEVTKATRQDIATYLTLDGQITPQQSSTLSSPQSGNVTAVYANEGDRVSSGQLLAKIDDSSLRAQLAQAQGSVVAAEAKLRGSAITQPIQSTQYGSSMGQASARVSSDRASLQNARLVYESNVKLFPQGYISQTDLEQSRATYVAAQQQLSSDIAAADAAHAGLGQTQADLQNVEANRGALTQAQGLVQQLQTEVAQTNVTAPFDGVVTARLLDPGAFAGPNAPILTVSQIATVYVNANVPDDDLSYVQTGTQVNFTTTSLPGRTFHGAITDVNATPTEGTLSYRARVRYPNADDSLRGGMLVSVVVREQYHHAAVVVPRTAVFETDSGDNVFTVKDNKAVQVPVHLGLQTDTLAEVQGVTPGTVVITARPDSLQDGGVVAI